MMQTLAHVSILVCLVLVVLGEEQCGGGAPIKDLMYGCDTAYETANTICCHNHVYAENRGFLTWSDIDLFNKLDPNVRTTFYDSVCGKPLFVAPVGRSFEEFKSESIAHGWPSFRQEETVDENVIIHPGGRMESICGTHLGHNLPDSKPRFCIDLVCIAGRAPAITPVPGSSGDNSTGTATDDFDAYNFTHKQYVPSGLSTWSIVGVVLGVLALVACGGYFMAKNCQKKNAEEMDQKMLAAVANEPGNAGPVHIAVQQSRSSSLEEAEA